MEFYTLFGVIFTIIIAGCIYVKCFTTWTDSLSHIAQPWPWPILKHYPYFWNADELDTYAEFAHNYKDEGLFRIDTLRSPVRV